MNDRTENLHAEAGAPMRSLSADEFTGPEMYLLLRDCVLPRPIAWVSTVDAAGRANLAPFSFFTVCSPEPPVLGFAVGERTGGGVKDTLANARASRELVVSIVPEKLAEPMVRTSTDLAPGESEFAFAGLAGVPSLHVRPPRVALAPVAFECRLHDIVPLGTYHWIMARIVHLHVDERAYLGRRKGVNHRVDLLALEPLRPLGRLGRANYVRLREIDTILRSDGPND